MVVLYLSLIVKSFFSFYLFFLLTGFAKPLKKFGIEFLYFEFSIKLSCPVTGFHAILTT